MEQEIARLKSEIAAKDDSLNQLRTKAKAFAEALTHEKKQLEAQLNQSISELNELKAKAKAFADNVKVQILNEKERVQVLEKQALVKDNEIVQLKLKEASSSSAKKDDEDKESRLAAKDREMHERTQAFEQQLNALKAANLQVIQSKEAQEQQIRQLKAESEKLKLLQESQGTNELHRIEELNRASSFNEEKLKNMAQENEKLTGKIQLLLTAIQSVLSTSSTSNLVMFSEEDYIIGLQQHASSTSAEIKLLQEKLTQNLDQVQMKETQIQDLQRRCDQALGQQHLLEQQLAELNSSLRTSSASTSEILQRSEQTIRELKVQLQELQNQQVSEKVNTTRGNSCFIFSLS